MKRQYCMLTSIVFILFFCGTGTAFTPVETVQSLPRPPLQRIMFNGKAWLSRPVADRQGNLYIVWRAISGAVYKELVTSVFFQKLKPDGRLAWGAQPKVPAQAMHSLGDRGQGAGSTGIAPDGKGGVYYLWASYLLRFDARGKTLWPKGKMIRRQDNELWRRPSRVRYLKSKREKIQDARLFPDGKGNALVFWRAPNSYRINKISHDGKRLWGDRGLPLVTNKETYERGTAVSDWNGGAVALVAHGRYGNKSIIKYINANGKVTRTSAVLNIDIQASPRWRAASDGMGGVVILYLKAVFQGGNHLGFMVHLSRYNRLGRLVYDETLSPLVHWKQKPERLYVRTDRQGNALANWRYKVNGTGGRPQFKIFIARLDKRGRQPWSRRVVIAKPGKSNNSYFNSSGTMELLAVGDVTYVLYELSRDVNNQETVFIILQKITKKGNFILNGPGRTLSQHGGFTPYLTKINNRPVAFYFDTKQVGKVSNQVVPMYVRLD